MTTSLDGRRLFEQDPAVTEVGVDAHGNLGRPVAFWRQLCRFDPTEAYRGLACPICTVRGSADCASHPEDQESIVRAAEGAALTAHAVTLDGLDHSLLAAESPAESCRAGGRGAPDCPRLARAMMEWMNGLPPAGG